jgi:DNA segregation ATPase FtsK/SpoIIIE-like protein
MLKSMAIIQAVMSIQEIASVAHEAKMLKAVLISKLFKQAKIEEATGIEAAAVAQEGEAVATVATTAAVETQTVAVGLGARALAFFNSLNPLGWIVLAGTAIAGLIGAISLFSKDEKKEINEFLTAQQSKLEAYDKEKELLTTLGDIQLQHLKNIGATEEQVALQRIKNANDQINNLHAENDVQNGIIERIGKITEKTDDQRKAYQTAFDQLNKNDLEEKKLVQEKENAYTEAFNKNKEQQKKAADDYKKYLEDEQRLVRETQDIKNSLIKDEYQKGGCDS